MAWTGAALTAAELADLALDRPIINGRQLGDFLNTTTSRWVVGTITAQAPPMMMGWNQL